MGCCCCCCCGNMTRLILNTTSIVMAKHTSIGVFRRKREKTAYRNANVENQLFPTKSSLIQSHITHTLFACMFFAFSAVFISLVLFNSTFFCRSFLYVFLCACQSIARSYGVLGIRCLGLTVHIHGTFGVCFMLALCVSNTRAHTRDSGSTSDRWWWLDVSRAHVCN